MTSSYIAFCRLERRHFSTCSYFFVSCFSTSLFDLRKINGWIIWNISELNKKTSLTSKIVLQQEAKLIHTYILCDKPHKPHTNKLKVHCCTNITCSSISAHHASKPEPHVFKTNLHTSTVMLTARLSSVQADQSNKKGQKSRAKPYLSLSSLFSQQLLIQLL